MNILEELTEYDELKVRFTDNIKSDISKFLNEGTITIKIQNLIDNLKQMSS